MRMRLHLALMAIPAVAISLSTPSVQAETAWAADAAARGSIIGSQENGRVVYVNDSAPHRSPAVQTWTPPATNFMYWSSTERRWKRVSAATHVSMRAARSAAAEVREILTHEHAGGGTFSSTVAGDFATDSQINSAIDQAAARHNVDPNLVRAVIKVESNFNPRAVSRKGAMGLMQLMPGTAKQLKVSNPFDPQQNVDAGVRYLRSLLDNFGGDVKLTLAAYNAGTGAVLRSAGIPRYSETQNYVKRITNLYRVAGTSGGGLLAPRRDPVRVFRDSQGVLTMTNTD